MSKSAPKVLLIEDEAEIRRFVRMTLEQDGFDVYEADGVKRGLIEVNSRHPDLLVLDLGLPDGDGVDLIRNLRSWSDIPILVLSARTSEDDKIVALDAGADDYLMKPFGAGELRARLRAHLRRRSNGVADPDKVLEFGDVKVDLGRRMVERAGAAVHLTPIEYRLLTHLTAHPDCVLTHRQILRTVWGSNHTDDSHYVRVYMGHLRSKLEADPSQPKHLLTETGIGYRFVP